MDQLGGPLLAPPLDAAAAEPASVQRLRRAHGAIVDRKLLLYLEPLFVFCYSSRNFRRFTSLGTADGPSERAQRARSNGPSAVPRLAGPQKFRATSEFLSAPVF